MLSIASSLHRSIVERTLILDGAIGSLLLQLDRPRRGLLPRKADCSSFCPDLLVLSRPDLVASVHDSYLDAGADIITTNSFNANNISLDAFGLGDCAFDVSFAAAKIARHAANRFASPDKPRFVAGSVGPPPFAVSASTFRDAVSPQIEGLLLGGCDLILVETAIDPLLACAALDVAVDIADRLGRNVPLMVSASVDHDGFLPSGCPIDEFCRLVAPFNPLSVGINCAFGPDSLHRPLDMLAAASSSFISCHPNAGLPDSDGVYPIGPLEFADILVEYVSIYNINIVGACCGSSPAFIRILAEKLAAPIV